MKNYAIELLEREIYLIEKCLSEWELNKYTESKTERELKLKDLRFAVTAILLKLNELHN
jgi:hypothetical protein